MLTSRIAALVEYDGTVFNGWQTQQKGAFIEDFLVNSISKVADAPISIVAAGRTDSGVHASGQVIHFDTFAERRPYSWLCGINTHLPSAIRVRWIGTVTSDFHARYSALARRYRYLIYNSPTPSAFLTTQCTFERTNLDVEAMSKAAQFLVGEHDFSSFRDSQCQSVSPNRHVFACDVVRSNDFVVIDITANAFVHHMVRNIAGSLLAIGKSKKEADWLKSVLEARDRRVAGITASPNGLYLVKVYYPSVFGVIDHEIGPYFHPGQRCPAPCDTRIIPERKKEA